MRSAVKHTNSQIEKLSFIYQAKHDLNKSYDYPFSILACGKYAYEEHISAVHKELYDKKFIRGKVDEIYDVVINTHNFSSNPVLNNAIQQIKSKAALCSFTVIDMTDIDMTLINSRADYFARLNRLFNEINDMIKAQTMAHADNLRQIYYVVMNEQVLKYYTESFKHNLKKLYLLGMYLYEDTFNFDSSLFTDEKSDIEEGFDLYLNRLDIQLNGIVERAVKFNSKLASFNNIIDNYNYVDFERLVNEYSQLKDEEKESVNIPLFNSLITKYNVNNSFSYYIYKYQLTERKGAKAPAVKPTEGQPTIQNVTPTVVSPVVADDYTWDYEMVVKEFNDTYKPISSKIAPKSSDKILAPLPLLVKNVPNTEMVEEICCECASKLHHRFNDLTFDFEDPIEDSRIIKKLVTSEEKVFAYIDVTQSNPFIAQDITTLLNTKGVKAVVHYEGDGVEAPNVYDFKTMKLNGKNVLFEDLFMTGDGKHYDDLVFANEIEFENERGFIGLENAKSEVKAALCTRHNTMMQGKKHKPITIALMSDPGTGKTSFARDFIGQNAISLGLITEPTFIEKKRSDLVSDHTGGTEKLFKDLLKQCKGGVLFVDEAHNLFVEGSNVDFGKRIITEFLDPLYSEEYSDTIFIFAGYKEEMKKLLQADRGFESRIMLKIEFDSYSSAELYKIFLSKFYFDESYIVKDDFLEITSEIIKKIHQNAKGIANFAYGREMEGLFTKINNYVISERKFRDGKQWILNKEAVLDILKKSNNTLCGVLID